MNNPFLSFKHKNYRYYICGMLISNIGTWMQNIAQPWLAYQLTNDALKIGIVSALQFLPILLFSLFAGAIIEKLNKKTMLLLTQLMLFIITLIFAILVFTNIIQYWHIVILAALMGTANAFDMPIRQSFIVQLVPKNDLMNAIAINSTIFNLARLIGPAIAGIIMGIYGVGFCFLLNSISFLAVIISLIFIKPIISEENATQKMRQTVKGILTDVKNGLKYVFKRKEILYILISNFFISGFSMNNNVLLPVFITNILHMEETSYGFIMTCMGIGSFIGSLLIASYCKKGPNRFFITFGPIIMGAGLILMGILKNYYATLLLYVIIGYVFVSYYSTSNTSIQMRVRDEYRSRVMSIYSLIFGGSIPFGSLFTGIIVRNFGVQSGYIINGSIVAISMLMFVFSTSKKNNDEIHK